MRLGWNEIRVRARAFSAEWKSAHYEKGDTQTFYNEFFEIFGINRKRVAIFERKIELIERNKRGFIDLFWPGLLLVEQKSAGRDLLKAQQQAYDYVLGLKDRDQPKFVLVCDFQRFRLIELETRREVKFTLPELHKFVDEFAFMLGVQRRLYGKQAAVNIKAAELLGKLHDKLEAKRYVGIDLERLLVRLLFCLFADDTGIFGNKDDFLYLIEERTDEDGSNVGPLLNQLFEILDTPEEDRQQGEDPELTKFPHVNGQLFRGALRTAVFNKAMREDLLDACKFDWGKVSPAIFGSLFQSVMDTAERRKKGAHYTTEPNIRKLIGPLFLDELRAELDRLKARRDGGKRAALLTFQEKLAGLNFLDPACGCGNFLVVTYRELRAMEQEVLEQIFDPNSPMMLEVEALSIVRLRQFYGIELEEFPAHIAEVAMWMAEHLANVDLGRTFGKVFAHIPLTDSANIYHGDALEIDWNLVLPHDECFAVMGNPPFAGAKYQSQGQREQVRRIAALGKSGGTLDYVAAWFLRAGEYVEGSPTRIAFVATNSISQGEQVAQLWPILFGRYGLEIAFAHRTFAWGSDARGKAHVHVVIIGLTHQDHVPTEKRLFSYDKVNSEPDESQHPALTPYLFGAENVANRHLVVKEASKPINGARKVVIGSKPIDGGYLIFTEAERATLREKEPDSVSLLRPFVGAKDFINGGGRWIAALQGVSPDRIKEATELMNRLDRVSEYRRGVIPAKGKDSKKLKPPGISARALARHPSAFHVTVIPSKPFLAIPEVSSERRQYIPLGWLEPPIIPSNLVRVLKDAELLEFGVLTSNMHMAWMRHIGGRLESRYRYSIGLVYNTFPWPAIGAKARVEIETLAKTVLDARAEWPTSNLASLYDPRTMPGNLLKAHHALDQAVDRSYRRKPFDSDRDRVEYLFGRYEALVNPLEREGVKQLKRVIRRAKAAK
jgi:hypothetical protein